MSKELRVLVNDREVGSVLQEDSGRLRFIYDEAWQNMREAFPLSLSMPIPLREHWGKRIENYLWGLLPDNDEALKDLAARFGVSKNNPFALIASTGEDLAGAVQIVPPENLQSLEGRKGVNGISDARLALFLADLVRYPGKTNITEDAGFFSLAGFQPKKAICQINGKWFEPRGRTPSTHIIKPPMVNLANQVENEHFCLRLANLLGLKAAKTSIVAIGGASNLLIERYDRTKRNSEGNQIPLTESGGVVSRIHQEDMCQALGYSPKQKYQHEGGPGISSIMKLLDGASNSRSDRSSFIKACAYNFIIGGIDAHAKNYSILIHRKSEYELAPLYDVISALPYDTNRFHSLAMTIGGERQWGRITPFNWERLAKACRYPASDLLAHISDLVKRLPSAADIAFAECENEGGDPKFLERLRSALYARCDALRKEYASTVI